MSGTLYLIPNLLGEGEISTALPPNVIEVVRKLRHFIVEDEKSARRFLKLCGVMPPFEGITLHRLDKHTSSAGKEAILKETGQEDAGVLSEAGCPAIADPGSDMVKLWHRSKGIVKPLVGPSSILLALMGSGFNGQGFSFHGYLPVQPIERQRRLRELEAMAADTGYTQVFIETPFRNEAMLGDLMTVCKPGTLLSIAADLTLPTEEIRTRSIEDWKKEKIELKGRPAVFSLWIPPVENRTKKMKYREKLEE